MKKKIQALIMSATLIIAMSAGIFAYADNSIIVKLDGETLNFDVPPQIIDGRTMVPMRAIFEAMGAEVDWNQDTQTVVATNDICIISATIDDNTMKVNGTPIKLDVSPQLTNNRTLIPARFVAEAFGATVEWDSSTATVIISSFKPSDDSPKNKNATKRLYTADGRDKMVSDYEMEHHKKVYWYDVPMQVMYKTSGETAVIPQSKEKNYKNAGWYSEPLITMYTIDGKTKIILQSEIEKYKNLGWYEEPFIKIYTQDGKTNIILKSEFELYKNAGWGLEPFVTMYAPDGRTITVAKTEVEAYKSVGWYEATNESQLNENREELTHYFTEYYNNPLEDPYSNGNVYNNNNVNTNIMMSEFNREYEILMEWYNAQENEIYISSDSVYENELINLMVEAQKEKRRKANNSVGTQSDIYAIGLIMGTTADETMKAKATAAKNEYISRSLTSLKIEFNEKLLLLKRKYAVEY